MSKFAIENLIVGKLNAFVKNDVNLKTWKTIRIGTGLKTTDEFISALQKSGIKISNWARDIMERSDFVSSISLVPMELDLCRMTTAEILKRSGSDKRSGTLAEIYVGINKIGGQLVPIEAGPQLRLQYLDQPDKNDEWLVMAMPAIEDIKGSSGGFHVFNLDVLCDAFWLGTDNGLPNGVWPSGYYWVFAISNACMIH